MNLQIDQEIFTKSIQKAVRFTSSKVQLPILGNILLSADKHKLNISSTNLEISINISLTAKVEKEGSITIPAKILGDLVGNLPKEMLTLEVANEHLKVTSGSFSSTLLGMASSDFPNIPKNINKDNVIQIPFEDFNNALSKTLFAVSTDEARPVLTGVLFEIIDGKLTLVATDGFRLSRVILKSQIRLHHMQNLKSSFIIPKNILNEITRIGSEEIIFEIQEKEKQVVFDLGDTVISSRLIEGNFPDYEKIIPASSQVKIGVGRLDMLQAVKLSAPFARDNSNIVKLGIRKEELVVSAESSNGGSQETKVEMRLEKEIEKDFEIAFNYKFLEDFLGNVDSEEIVIELSSTDKAGVFLDPKDENYLHLIMPVKI